MPAPKDPIKYQEWLKNLSQGHIRSPSKYWLGKKHSEEYKQKMSKSCIGKNKHSEEWKKKRSIAQMGENNSAKKVGVGKKISKALTGRKLSKETKRKISESNKGKTISDETRKKISFANKGKKRSEEQKNKLKGRKFSEETRKKMSIAQKGKTISDEQKKKQSIAISGNKNPFWGKTHSEETKKKLSIINQGKIGYWRNKKRPESTKRKISQARKGKPVLKRRGENAYNWKGGITPENIKIRRSLEYRLFRDLVFVRDKYTCQKYGTMGKNIKAHHIQNFAQFPELRFAIDNGITLSDKAHKEFHKKYGIKNNTREQLEEFLNN